MRDKLIELFGPKRVDGRRRERKDSDCKNNEALFHHTRQTSIRESLSSAGAIIAGLVASLWGCCSD